MKKTISIILVCILSIMIAGCKGGNSSNEAVTLKLGLPGGKDVTPMEIVDTFKATNPNITLELDESPWNEFKKKLKMQVAASNPPTAFIMDSGYIAALGGMGAAVDLSDRVKKDINADEYSKGLYSGADADGHIWGIPHALNSIAIYYNKTIFEKAGIPYPDENWTFEDLFDIAKKLTKDSNGDGVVDQYGFVYGTNITEGWLPFVSATGGAPLDKTRTKSMFSDEKTIEGFKKYMYPYEAGFAPSSEWKSTNGNSASAFYMGKVAMLLRQSSGITAINSNKSADFDYDVQIMPIGWDGNRYCVYVPNLWSVFSRTSKAEQDAAWAWIKHYLNEDSQMKVAEKLLAGFPIKKTALDYISNKNMIPANMKAFYEGIDEHGVTLYENKTFEEWRPKVDEIASKLANEPNKFDSHMSDIEQKVSEALQGEK